MIGYYTLAAFKVDFPEAVVGKTDAVLTASLNWAELILNSISDDYFAQKIQTLTVNGTGTALINLLQYTTYKCLSVISIIDVDSGEAYDQECYAVEDYYIELRTTPNLRAQPLQSPTWPKGVKNIRITGVFGWTTTPDLVKRATGLMAVVFLTSGSTESSVIDGQVVQSERIGSYSYSLSSASKEAAENKKTGVPEVDAIMELYKRDLLVLMDSGN